MTSDDDRAARPARSARRSPRAVVLGLAAFLGGLATWGGCSIEKHYEVLSFFFDGVPDPSLATVGVEPEGVRRVSPGTTPVSAHTAYLERRCDECHGRSARFGMSVTGFSELDATTCMKCHEDVKTEYRRMHGPVAAGVCLWCHQPHESPIENLLKTPSPDLCLACHGFQMDLLRESPYHADTSRNCLECHHGHGGETTGLLRADGDVGDDPPAPPPVPAPVDPIPLDEGEDRAQ